MRACVKKYTPAGLTSSILIAVSAVKDFWVACTVHRQVKLDTLKMQDKRECYGWSSRRQERIHSGVLIW